MSYSKKKENDFKKDLNRLNSQIDSYSKLNSS